MKYIFLLLLMCCSVVKADVINIWDFNANAWFTNPTCNMANCQLSNTQNGTLIKWGAESNPWNLQSALHIAQMGEQYGKDYNFDGDFSDTYGIKNEQIFGSLSNNQLITNGGWVRFNAFEHFNNIITMAGGNLHTVQVNTSFNLLNYESLVGMPLPSPWSGSYANINFVETENRDVCAYPSPNQTKCDDFFTGVSVKGPHQFWVGNDQYQLSFRFVAGPGATAVSTGTRTVNGITYEDFRIYTSEACVRNASNQCTVVNGATVSTNAYEPGYSSYFIEARMDHIKTVPEPGTIGIFAASLLGVGFLRKKV